MKDRSLKLRWDEQEETFLKVNCYKMTMEEIAKHLDRTVSSIKNKANKLGILIDKRWSDADDAVLRAEYKGTNAEEIATKLGRTKAAIVGRAFLAGLMTPDHKWSPEEDGWLEKHYPIRSDLHCAMHIGVTESAIRNRAHQLGYAKGQVEHVKGDVRRCESCEAIKELDDFQFNKSRNRYARRCRECAAGTAKKHPALFTPEQQTVILELYEEGKGAPEIAEITGYSKKSKIGRLIKQQGIARSAKQRWDIVSSQRRGEKIGKLTLVDYIHQGNEPAWECVCECGNEITIKQKHLRDVRSCGCIQFPKGEDHACWKGIGELSGGLFSRYRSEAKKRYIQFELNKEEAWAQFLSQDRKCALTGLLLTMGLESHDTASLDRIDSSEGYVNGNVQWVHKWVNLLKADLKESDLFSIVRAIYEYRGVDKMPIVPISVTLNRINRKSSK